MEMKMDALTKLKLMNMNAELQAMLGRLGENQQRTKPCLIEGEIVDLTDLELCFVKAREMTEFREGLVNDEGYLRWKTGDEAKALFARLERDRNAL
jgi:hypothetical protein